MFHVTLTPRSSQIINCHINASPPKLLDVATSNFAGAWIT